ncbi:hypothetical protein AAE478_005849 [Parahypoxylon ruwenzoriense]
MATFENQVASALQKGIVPGVVGAAKDKEGISTIQDPLQHPALTLILGKGKIDYSRTFSPENSRTYKEDTVLDLASMTKLHTSVAALQLIDKGLVTLDKDVSHLIPSFGRQEILTGFADDGAPITRKRQNPITLRRLLTHSAGAGYLFMSEGLAKVAAWKKASQNPGTVDQAFDLPLIYEPGEDFMYSSGIDRVGQLIKRLTGQDLEEYMR